MNARTSGIVLLTGQLCDAFATPMAGVISDRVHKVDGSGDDDGSPSTATSSTATRVKSRAFMHLAGTVLSVLTFLFVWVIPTKFKPDTALPTLYYASAAGLFNVGWAIVQVNHLALIPDLSSNKQLRTNLTSIRYGVTVLMGIIVYMSYYCLISFAQPRGEESRTKWRILAIIGLALGAAFNAFFYNGMNDYCKTREKKGTANYAGADRIVYSACKGGSDEEEGREWQETPLLREELNSLPQRDDSCATGHDVSRDSTESMGPNPRDTSFSMLPIIISSNAQWLTCKRFYVVAAIYMLTRLLINIINVYITFYLTKSVKLGATSVADLPLLMMVSSYLCATFGGSDWLNTKLGRRMSYLTGSLITCAGCLLCSNFQQIDFVPTVARVYASAVLFGVGTSVVMVGGVSFVNDLVGENLTTSAFVYGCMSFTDKLSTGIVVIAIQNHRNRICGAGPDADEEECGDFVRQVIVYVPVVGCALALLCIFFCDCRRKQI